MSDTAIDGALPDRPVYRPKDWKAEARVGNTKMWQLIRDGELKIKRVGRCTFILTSPRQWLESLPERAA